jgi:hypothetical protein
MLRSRSVVHDARPQGRLLTSQENRGNPGASGLNLVIESTLMLQQMLRLIVMATTSMGHISTDHRKVSSDEKADIRVSGPGPFCPD